MDEEEQKEKKEERESEEEALAKPAQESPLHQDFLGPKEKKKGLPVVPIIIVIIVALGAGAFVFFRGQGGKNSDDLSFIDETTSTSSPFPTPIPPTIERSEIKTQVLNGTGIGGEAALLKDKLTSQGYSDVEAGNAKEEGTMTTVAFGSTVPEAVKSEIRSLLEETYQTVQEKGSVSGDFDVQITTGLRKGQTPKPTPSPTPKATATPKASPTGSPTASPTSSPTPSPTATP